MAGIFLAVGTVEWYTKKRVFFDRSPYSARRMEFDKIEFGEQLYRTKASPV